MWSIIIAATIFSFVFLWGRYGNGGGSEGNYNYGIVDGQRVSGQDFREAETEVLLQRRFQDRNDTRDKAELPEVYDRILLIRKTEQMNIHVGSATVAQAALGYLRMYNEPSFESFAARVFGGKLTADDFQRYLRHELAIEEMFTLYGVPGDLVSKQEAEMLYLRMRQDLAVQAVFFSASNYLAEVPPEPDPSLLRQYYTNNLAKYRLPERVQVNYVWFNVTNNLAAAEKTLGTNINALVENNYNQLGTNYVRVGKTPEEARARIRELLIRQTAMTALHRQVNEFANTVLEITPPTPENLDRVARTNGMEVKTTAPFDAVQGPKELSTAYNFPQAAFQLDFTNQPISQPIPNEDGFYMLALKARLPEEANRPLEAVRSEVVADYKLAEARQLAQQAGDKLNQMVTNSPGKSFAEICAQAKLTPTPIKISLSNAKGTLPEVEDHLALQDFKQAAFSTEPGKTSPFYPTEDGGLVVHVDELVPINPVVMAAEMPEFLSQLRNKRRQEAFSEWYSRERMAGLREVPALQKAAQGAAGLPEQ